MSTDIDMNKYNSKVSLSQNLFSIGKNIYIWLSRSVSCAEEGNSLEFPFGWWLAFGVQVHSENQVLISPLGILVDWTVVHRFVVSRFLLVDGSHVQ